MIHFAKMQGVGNDFVVVDAEEMRGRDLPALALKLCERRFGVGSDGMLVIGRGSRGADIDFRMFNPDGSEDMCGNGLRCSILWAYRRGMAGIGTRLLVRGFDRNRACRLVSVAADRRSAMVTVDMGHADFASQHIPYAGPPSRTPGMPVDFPIAGRIFPLTPVSTGSAHCVIFTEREIDEETFQTVSPLIENHDAFPERTSIMWAAQDAAGRYRIRIWERAAGETLGCGTGATAVAAVAWAQGRTPPENKVTVASRGGELAFDQEAGGSIAMTGPAEWIFEGRASTGE